MRRRARVRGGVVTDALAGALAGAAAGWVMGRVTTFLYARQDPVARIQEELVRDGRLAHEVAAQKVMRLFGRELDEDGARKIGTALHQAMGLGGGAAYAVLRRRLGRDGLLAGLLFGLAYFLVVDELANAALGFTAGPRAFPWQAHARGLAGHLAYGMATEAELAMIDSLASGARRHLPS
jgi:hypothetical protein